jgi:predicted small secreted protein
LYRLRVDFEPGLQVIDLAREHAGMEPAYPAWRSHVVFVFHFLKEITMKSLLIALLGLFVLSLTACNTVEGAGKDVKATGAAVEKAADNAKPK